MRKIYQQAPDVPQGIANKAIDIIERHFAACGVRRAEELPEENKVHLLRELQKFFQSELHASDGKDGETGHSWGYRRGGFLGTAVRWLGRALNLREPDSF